MERQKQIVLFSIVLVSDSDWPEITQSSEQDDRWTMMYTLTEKQDLDRLFPFPKRFLLLLKVFVYFARYLFSIKLSFLSPETLRNAFICKRLQYIIILLDGQSQWIHK
jgi:hypothetical protein